MRFITVRDLRTAPAQIWKSLSEEQEMVLTNNGKPIALISSIDETTLEKTTGLLRRVRAQLALQEAQRYAVMNDIQLTEEEIELEIQEARKSLSQT